MQLDNENPWPGLESFEENAHARTFQPVGDPVQWMPR